METKPKRKGRHSDRGGPPTNQPTTSSSFSSSNRVQTCSMLGIFLSLWLGLIIRVGIVDELDMPDNPLTSKAYELITAAVNMLPGAYGALPLPVARTRSPRVRMRPRSHIHSHRGVRGCRRQVLLGLLEAVHLEDGRLPRPGPRPRLPPPLRRWVARGQSDLGARARARAQHRRCESATHAPLSPAWHAAPPSHKPQHLAMTP